MADKEEIIFPIRSLKMAEGKEQGIHKVLQTVVLLDNGEYGYVYRDLGPYRNDKKFMCNVCKRVLVFTKGVLTHNVHPTHKTNLKIPMHCSSKFPETTSKIPDDAPTLSDDEMDLDDQTNEEEASVIPGEPVPPGLEDVVEPVCQIQAAFDEFKSGPLIGLEYIVELISIEQADAEPRYICLLCEKKGDPRSVMVHVTSYNHYLKYICCFFRTVGNKLNLIPKTNNRSAINTAIIKVAEAIEKTFGRLKPITAEMETFTQKKYQILREIDDKEHFRETSEINFLELITATKLEEYSKNPVVNFNIKDLDLKNEELTKKWIESNQKFANKNLDKRNPERSVDNKPAVKSAENIEQSKKAAVKEPLATQNPPKKLCISLNKPERSIPGLTKPQVQNIDIVVKKEADDNTANSENRKDDDDVIILADSSKDPIEVHSLSSVSSRSRSWSRSRNSNRAKSRSPRHSYQRSSSRRSRSKDRFGRTRRSSRESSYDRYGHGRDNVSSRDRDRDWKDGDRSKRDFDDRTRRDFDDRRRLDDRDRRGDSRGRRGDSRGHRMDSRSYRSRSRGRRGDSRGYRGDSRGRRDNSRDRYVDRGHYNDRRRSDDRRDILDRDRRDRDRMRNPSPDRYRDNKSSWRDRNHESEERSYRIAEEMKKKNKWNLYKEELSKLEDDLEKTYKFYQSHPEKHPSYNEEWKAFWNRRYKEIQMSGQDPSKYDFKPEWILFWEKKMKEIHEQKVITEKENLKRKHNLDDLQDIRNDRDLQDISPPTPDANKDVTVNDIKKTWKALTGSEITAPKSASSTWESKSRDKDSGKDNDVGLTSQQFFAPSKPSRPSSGVAPVPLVIHCLRMLSVLEQQIGFQASRVIELLAQGLAMEKTKENHSMTLLQNKDIYLFFEAMKEKLRGQLMAGIVQRHLVSATRNVIKTIEGMLETNPLKKEVFEPVTIPGVGEVDKMAVAQKIAGAIIKMGKTNVSQEELEQLINAVVGMANASSVSADVSSDKFFSQLNIKNSNASSHINSILSSLIQTAQQSEFSNPCKDIPEKLPSSFKNDDDQDSVETRNSPERGPSPFSSRMGSTNPIKHDEKKDLLVNYDDDDDDYSFEDVYTAASEKLKKSEENTNVLISDDNSQTQSSLASAPASIPPKNSSDILGMIDPLALSSIASTFSMQPKDNSSNPSGDVTGLGDISKGLNLSELQSLLNQNQVAVEKPSIDLSLVESIKDTLVQSFTQSNVHDNFSSSHHGGYSGGDDRPRERPTLDPRSRSVWDPSIKGLDSKGEYLDARVRDQWDERGNGRPSVWEDRVWDSQSRESRLRDERSWDNSNGPWATQPWEPGYGPATPYGRPSHFGNESYPGQSYGRAPLPPFDPHLAPNFRNRPPFY